MDSLKFQQGPPSPTLLHRVGGQPLRPFQGWPIRRVGGLRPSTSLLDTLHRAVCFAGDGALYISQQSWSKLEPSQEGFRMIGIGKMKRRIPNSPEFHEESWGPWSLNSGKVS
jgi:hypothetical protein